MACTASLSPANVSVPLDETNGSATLTIRDGCSWTVASNASWIGVTSGGTGTGPATVNYTAAANPGSSTRNGTLTIAQQTFTVTQDGAPCHATLSPASQDFPAGGGSGMVSVGMPDGCAWESSASGFVTMTNGSGIGSGSASYSVAGNSSSSNRSQTITIAGRSFVVSQAASRTPTPSPSPTPPPMPSPSPTPPPSPTPTPSPSPTPTCTIRLSPSGYSGVGADAGGGGINVSAPAGCSWTAVSNAAWITINKTRFGPGAGETWTGPGEVSFSVTANTTGASRTGTLTIGGQTFTVQQNAQSCNQANAAISPPSASFGKAGGTGTITVTYTAGCAWDWLPVLAVDWVTAVSPGTKTGSTTVSYTVAPNNTGGGRNLFLTIVGKSFQISQAAN